MEQASPGHFFNGYLATEMLVLQVFWKVYCHACSRRSGCHHCQIILASLANP